MKWWLMCTVLLFLPAVSAETPKISQGLVLEIKYTESGLSQTNSIVVTDVGEDTVEYKYWDDDYPKGNYRTFVESFNLLGNWFVDRDWAYWGSKITSHDISVTSASLNEWNLTQISLAYEESETYFVFGLNYTQLSDEIEEFYQYHIYGYTKTTGILAHKVIIDIDAQTDELTEREWLVLGKNHTSNLNDTPLVFYPIVVGLAALRRKNR